MKDSSCLICGRSDHVSEQCRERESEKGGESFVEVDSLDRPWFRSANRHCRALARIWLLTPTGWVSIYTLHAKNVPFLAGMNLLENHDISFK